MRAPSRSSPDTLRLLQLLAGAAVLCMLLVAVVPPSGPALYALPLLLVVIPLLVGRYPGERVLEEFLRRRERPRATRSPLQPRRRPLVAVLGGRLVACSLGGRAPPPALTRA